MAKYSVSHEGKTLEQITEIAQQAECVAFMLQNCVQEGYCVDVETVSGLLSKLCGNVAAWLVEESATGGSHAA